MPHEFVIKRNGVLETYQNYEDIPLDFDHIIKFKPEVPEPPHSEAQHKEMDTWNEKLKKLMEIENARSN